MRKRIFPTGDGDAADAFTCDGGVGGVSRGCWETWPEDQRNDGVLCREVQW